MQAMAHAHSRARNDWMESAAVGASLLCLAHCLALPLIIAALPALSNVLAIPETFHLWVLGFAVPASGAALVAGRARHGARWPLALGALGLILLAVGAILFGSMPAETPTTVAGSLLLVTAHLCNWRLRRGRPPATGA